MTSEKQVKGQKAEASDTAAPTLHYNLNGQKLGRKGRDTRERILAAAAEALECMDETPISLSAVARNASLGMTSLYNYFTDLTELLLAMLEPVMETAEESHLAILRQRWPEAELAERCEQFVGRFHAFWLGNASLLHLRNTMADSGDRRMLIHRVTSTQPMIRLFAEQMDGDPADRDGDAVRIATLLVIAAERTITVSTDRTLTGLFGDAVLFPPEHYLAPAARVMELAIADARRSSAA